MKQALPASTWCLYEPAHFDPSDPAGLANVLAKIVIGLPGEFDYTSFRQFDRKIIDESAIRATISSAVFFTLHARRRRSARTRRRSPPLPTRSSARKPIPAAYPSWQCPTCFVGSTDWRGPPSPPCFMTWRSISIAPTTTSSSTPMRTSSPAATGRSRFVCDIALPSGRGRRHRAVRAVRARQNGERLEELVHTARRSVFSPAPCGLHARLRLCRRLDARRRAAYQSRARLGIRSAQHRVAEPAGQGTVRAALWTVRAILAL